MKIIKHCESLYTIEMEFHYCLFNGLKSEYLVFIKLAPY